MSMKVELNKKLSEMVRDLAAEQGMTEDEVVEQIVEWYFVDNSD